MSEDNFAMGYALGQDGGNRGGFFGDDIQMFFRQRHRRAVTESGP